MEKDDLMFYGSIAVSAAIGVLLCTGIKKMISSIFKETPVPEQSN